MSIRSNLSFALNHERHYLKIYGVFNFSDIQCYVVFLGEDGVFFGLFPSQFNPLLTKNPVMLHTVGCKILSRL